MLHDYAALAGRNPDTKRSTQTAKLDSVLPALWSEAYRESVGSEPHLVTVTFGSAESGLPFCRVLFHLVSGAPAAKSQATVEQDNRVVAVWGVSRPENSGSRDKSRLGGLLRTQWSNQFPGYDRGHFFAHTMGGGLDINLFPQIATVNRKGPWRKMERYCARHAGTFCFVHPIYCDQSWRPALLELGIFKTAEGEDGSFWGQLFEN
jgi:hypothetical protein